MKMIDGVATARHGEILSNRVKKRLAFFRKRYAREGIASYRLYDWDIPEVRIVVDWYDGHLVVSEYERLQTGPDYLPDVAEILRASMGLPHDHIHLKSRRTMVDEGPRYDFHGGSVGRLAMQERDLKFWVNLDDYLDTGLYSDHRNTRQMVAALSPGKDFLNLFAHTGAFTCAAAKGGAKTTTTVDRNETYNLWTKDNLELNGLSGPQHRLVQADVSGFLGATSRTATRYDLCVVDPPSFFTDRDHDRNFDVNRDHVEMLRAVFTVMRPKSVVFFSTNHQRFEPHLEELDLGSLEEITAKTVPEDYRNRQVHRCWKIITKP